MKKIIKNVRDYVQAKIDKYVVKRFVEILPKELIKSLYRQIAENELQITTKIVEVKKGKIRYTLMVVKDKNLQTVFNLGRHYEQTPVVTVR
jgi:transposase